MTEEKKLFTSESVTEGHPDKIADQISDAILDEILTQDPFARVACETMITTGLVFVSGEITTEAYVDIPQIVRKTLSEIGYTDSSYGFDANTCGIMTSIDEQSPDIAQGVDEALESREKIAGEKIIGAGDQGLMFGYACDETDELMPLPIFLSHQLAKRLADVRKNGELPYLRPDGKTQVTVEYDEKEKPLRIDTIILSTQHAENISSSQMKDDLTKNVIQQTVPGELLDEQTKIFINPSGRFVIGGPMGDVGLTGRKIIVDTYGGYARHGGGAFSGKDPTKVDRSAAYAARYVAKNIVASGLAKRCEVQLAYAIGVAEPVSIAIDTFGTAIIKESELVKAVRELFDLTPQGMIEMLDLRKPHYQKTAAYGHFGRKDIQFPWERTDKAEPLKKILSK